MIVILLFVITFGLYACVDNDYFENRIPKNEYGAQVVSLKSSFRQEFLNINNINARLGQIDNNLLYEKKTFVISNDNEFDAIFEKDLDKIDYEKELLIIYVFATVYASNTFYVENITLNNNVLNIDLGMITREGYNNATQPVRTLKIIKMKKVEFDNVLIND